MYNLRLGADNLSSINDRVSTSPQQLDLFTFCDPIHSSVFNMSAPMQLTSGVPGAADSFVFPCLSTLHCLRHTSHEIKGYAGYKRRSIYSKIFNLEQGNTWKPLKLCCPVSCVQRPLDCIFFNSNQGCVRLHVDKFKEFKPWPLPLYLFFLLPFGAMILREISLIN